MKLFTAVLFLSVYVQNCRSWVDYNMVPTNAWVVFANKSLASKVSFVLNKYNRTTTTISLNATLLHTLHENVKYKFHMAEYLSGGVMETSFLDTTIDVCQIPTETDKQKKFVFQTLTGLIKKYTNIPTSCPFSKGFLYIKDYLAEDEYLPPYFPGYKWRIDFAMCHNEDMVFKISFVAFVDRTQKLRESLLRKMG